MDQTCEIVRDLLPLYLDDACSDASRALVETHLTACSDCTSVYDKMKNDAPTETLHIEKEGLITRQAKLLRRKGAVAGGVVGGILLLPVVICLIVNLAVGHALDWFFLVLTSLLLVGSLTVVPLLSMKHRFLRAVASATASLLLLFLACCLYTGGRWFFVASTASIFGLAVVLLPIVVNCEPIKTRLRGQKALTCMAVDTVLLCLMLVVIGMRAVSDEYPLVTLAATLPNLVFAWGLFALIRYSRVSGLAKAGLCTVWTGLYLFSVNTAVGFLLRSPVALPQISDDSGRILWLLLIGSSAVGALLIAVGQFANKKRGKNT